MKRLKLCRPIAVLALAIALAPSTASAQEADTLSISGTFGADGLWLGYPGMIGADLAEVLVNGNVHGWTLTLHGISYSHDYILDEGNDGGFYYYYERYVTRVDATSFDFKFFGPDADILNAVVSSQLAKGSGTFFELWNGVYDDSWGSWVYSTWCSTFCQLIH